MMTLRRLLAVRDEAIIEAGTAWIYEPFFTGARGSGPGLPIFHPLVTDLLCGTLRAGSTPGRDARSTVRFPAHAEA
ncbi:hypothetical protein [Nannocystis pusilla]|uniref:hypothetical protein n=1 Tax=Nannocystis pusilla TaxID=889268 RepID=UPI003DA2CCFC